MEVEFKEIEGLPKIEVVFGSKRIYSDSKDLPSKSTYQQRKSDSLPIVVPGPKIQRVCQPLVHKQCRSKKSSCATSGMYTKSLQRIVNFELDQERAQRHVENSGENSNYGGGNGHHSERE